jgi:hypothetical protein
MQVYEWRVKGEAAKGRDNGPKLFSLCGTHSVPVEPRETARAVPIAMEGQELSCTETQVLSQGECLPDAHPWKRRVAKAHLGQRQRSHWAHLPTVMYL